MTEPIKYNFDSEDCPRCQCIEGYGYQGRVGSVACQICQHFNKDKFVKNQHIVCAVNAGVE